MVHFVFMFFSLFLGLTCTSLGKPDKVMVPVGPLPAELRESSGMVILDHDLYLGNNDSGNPAELCVFSLNGKLSPRVIKISGAKNQDWEDLADDSTYIYIADTGNNSGTRKNLLIYKIRKQDLLERDEVSAEKIAFFYPEQKEFKPSNNHNFDCEALVSLGDSLYLFTKNRGNKKTDLYSLPKTPGTFPARHLGQFDAQGLITGADVRTVEDKNELILVGYMTRDKGYHPFLLYFKDVTGSGFFEVPVKRFLFEGRLQTETVVFYDEGSVYISNEMEHGDLGLMYQVDIRI